MYYEEELINGVLMFRTSPDGDWEQCSIEDIGQRFTNAKLEIEYLRAVIGELKTARYPDNTY